MITIQDCIAMSGLSEPEILAIAEHEHLPEIVAAELGNFLLDSSEGQEIETWIRDDITVAQRRGYSEKAGKLGEVLTEFRQRHPRNSRLAGNSRRQTRTRELTRAA